jgi:FkbM family methyltransferase
LYAGHETRQTKQANSNFGCSFNNWSEIVSILDGIRSTHRMFGYRGLQLVAKSRLLDQRCVVTVQAKQLSRPVHLRLRTTDISVYEEVILNAEYELSFATSPKIIVDAGANIGLTSVYFADRYPDATVLAIEPEPSNFELLCKNAAHYPNIVPLRAALWNKKTRLSLFDAGTGNWGFQTRQSADSSESPAGVEAVTIASLMQTYSFDRIDLLKIDIEGAEKEVFEDCADWIDTVDVLMVELHDRFKPGCGDSVHAATRRFARHWQRGETLFFTSFGAQVPKSAVPLSPEPFYSTQGAAVPTRSRIIASSC